ncbi:C2H2 type zinc finger domain protein [Penicillium paradoxum]|uniref:C2H2 type zinc finger domain protein n=1 Tax=Penicillium paradoxum TaxID=176176 RepID=UPI002546A18A|nr:C2H2 type zinc finger domain protein [Penicillium paradoxum]KAJ5773290.1 C2H2 type zinc finger domain protein [Penicillium paradoxum]
MTDLSARASGPPLSESYLECIQSFGLFVQALSEDDCRVVHLEQIQLSEILEGYGRIKIWGDQSKAELPARARGSLDDTLRHDDELRSLVQGILTRLKAILGQGKSHNSTTYIARRKYDPAVGSDHDSISSVSANSDSDSDEGGEHQRHRMPKICLLVQQTLEQIRSLFDLSALLRRPKIADKYIRSVDSKSHTATLSDPEILPINLGFSSSDEGHIVEKMLQWRGLTKSGQCIQFEDEEVTPTGQGLTYDRVEDVMWFCKRLAGANTRRREQLQYWADHPYDHKKATTDIPVLDAPNLEQVVAKQMREPQKSQSQASTLKPPKSTVSKQSFSTAAVSDIYDTKTNVRPRTVYAPTTIGQGRYSSVPDPPRMEDGKTTFLCPYCGMTLESSEMKNRQVWK